MGKMTITRELTIFRYDSTAMVAKRGQKAHPIQAHLIRVRPQVESRFQIRISLYSWIWQIAAFQDCTQRRQASYFSKAGHGKPGDEEAHANGNTNC